MIDEITLENLRKVKERKREKKRKEKEDKCKEKKERRGSAKETRISQEKVKKIVEMLEKGYTYNEISSKLKVSHPTIAKIKKQYNVQKGYKLKIINKGRGQTGVTIPKEYLNKLNLKKGDYVFMRITELDGKLAIVITPFQKIIN